jgi:hypothetical protein
MLRWQNFPAMFLTCDSSVLLQDGCGGRITVIRNWHGCLSLVFVVMFCAGRGLGTNSSLVQGGLLYVVKLITKM